MRLILNALVVVLLLSGCGEITPTPPKLTGPVVMPEDKNKDQNDTNVTQDDQPSVYDLRYFPQAIDPYIDLNGIDRDNLYDIQKLFEPNYFRPWTYVGNPISVNEASYAIRAYRIGYGSNLRPIPAEWFKKIAEQSNFEAFGSINQKGIMLKWTNMRVLPTDKPLYRHPTNPGASYPFDLLQNSSVNYQEPIYVSHYSKDRSWCYVFANNASGWVEADKVTLLSDQVVQEYQSRPKIFILEDNLPLYDENNRFIAYSRVGMVLPLEQEGGDYYLVRVYHQNNTIYRVRIPKASGRLGVSKLNKNDLRLVANQMLKNTYGWGGMFGERDCSSTIRDMMTPFGIWLPRNSAAQSRRGEVIALSGLTNDQKLALIVSKGVPFETILYLNGHVMLYVGTYENNVMILHDIWGLRTVEKGGASGRFVIGKTVISTLKLGSDLENLNPDSLLLSRIQSMNIFTHDTGLTQRQRAQSAS